MTHPPIQSGKVENVKGTDHGIGNTKGRNWLVNHNCNCNGAVSLAGAGNGPISAALSRGNDALQSLDLAEINDPITSRRVVDQHVIEQ